MQFQTLPNHTLKRRTRSPSPGPASKRRAPPSYIPQLYASLPPTFARSLSVEALGGTPVSERASPGPDWLHQTEQLGIHTPPVSCEERFGASERDTGETGDDVRMEQSGAGQDHTMSDDPPHPPPQPSFTPLAASYPSHPTHAPPSIFSSGFAFADPTFVPCVAAPAPRAPHDAPPLHQHLAGSPGPFSSGMTPSSSDTSIHSFSHSHSHPYPHPAGLHDMPQDVPMSPGSAAKHGKGGWKVTMGYRPDCDKCQQRVPGHYSHVVYTS
ncbi:hypothetical protein JCM11641_003831 [Rhodosporidiobolus odoratus]